VVILHSAFGTSGTAAAPFNLGRTASHEIGHWLNLRHIWGDDGTGCAGSDFVADTPNAGGPNFGTPTFPNVSCNNGPNGDLFMNYMDYVDDVAMFMFTVGQVDRMQAALDGPRSSIGVTGPCDGKPPKDLPKEFPKDFPKEFPKEFPKDFPKEFPKDFPKDPPKDFPKDPPKDFIKEPIKETPKDLGFDPPKPPAGDGPFPGGGGATPFVLGGGPGRAEIDPLTSIVQQLGAILTGYSAAAAQGQLDARDTARWQQLSAIYAQIVALLG
jgi:hypothetical protein